MNHDSDECGDPGRDALDPRKIPIGEIGLSVRITEALENCRVTNLEELAALSDAELRAISNLSEHAILRLQEVLSLVDLRLRSSH